MVYEMLDTAAVSPLFHGWEETLIWSCLQGVMGKIYADHPQHPASAVAVLGDFSFLAGRPDRQILSCNPSGGPQDFRILVPQNEGWKTLVTQIYGENANIVSRYAFKKEPRIFDKQKLEKAAASLPEQYRLSMIDRRLYHLCRVEAWSADLVSQFSTYEKYQELGLGVVICKDNFPVSGASSYSRYRGGIEIEIDTKEEYRRKGLAYACGARLILECLKRNLYPSWDAQNKDSAALAEKLGYHYSHTYTAIEVRNASSYWRQPLNIQMLPPA